MSDVTPRLKTERVIKKRQNARRIAASCSVRGCKRRPAVLTYCKTHATERADKLFAGLIRSRGFCQSGRDSHLGNLQCAHGFSRSYRATRWDARQCWCLCAGCHLYYTHHPLEWDEWLLDHMGHEVYYAVRGLALSHEPPDMDALLSGLESITERMA